MLERSTDLVAGKFARPVQGLQFAEDLPLPLSGDVAWVSHGGVARQHPYRTNPQSLTVTVPGEVKRIHLVGIFALQADSTEDASGTQGATLQLLRGDEVQWWQPLLAGRHYSACPTRNRMTRLNGDGTSLEYLGTVSVDGVDYPVNLLTVDVPLGAGWDTFRFQDCGTPAAFVIFDVLFEVAAAVRCPFHSSARGVSLAELTTAIRIGDRAKFQQAFSQMQASVARSEGLDEARGMALSFFSTLVVTLMEVQPTRSLHWAILEHARGLDRCETPADIARFTSDEVEVLSRSVFKPEGSPSSHLIDRALAIINRSFGKKLQDDDIADQLGLSTSHFRFLFRQVTGQPFHKYLISLRLERAHQMLLQEDLTVAEVAKAVGFSGVAHFSRAFSQRFSVSPNAVRRNLQ